MIYLLRHGDAEEGDRDDAARRLTAKGVRQADAAGQALVTLSAGIDTCLASPKVRAAETAQRVCRALAIDVETAPELCGGRIDAVDLATGRGNALLVGHEPDLSNEVARLTGASIKLKKGGLAVVDGGTLVALLRPRDLAAVGRR